MQRLKGDAKRNDWQPSWTWVLATGPNSRFGTGSSSDPELDRRKGFLHKSRFSRVNISCSKYEFEFSAHRNMINTWNMQFDDLLHLPFCDLQSDQWSLSRIGNPVILAWHLAQFQSYSTSIDPITNLILGDETGHQSAHFTYCLWGDTMRIEILIWR